MVVPLAAKTPARPAVSPASKLAIQRSTLIARPFGMLQRTIGNQATLRLLSQRDRSPSGDGRSGKPDQEVANAFPKASRGSWDFANIPMFSPRQVEYFHSNSSIPASPFQSAIPNKHEADRIPHDMAASDDTTLIDQHGATAPQKAGRCAACEEVERADAHSVGAGRGGKAVATTTRNACGCGAHQAAATEGKRQDGVVHGPAGAPNRFDDCPTDWKPKANAAQALGSSWLDNAVNGLSSLPKPIPAPVAALLTKHFHTTLDKDLVRITERFAKLNTAIKQAIDFECETSCGDNVLAYVYSIWSDLHLCPYWFRSGTELQAATVIHELAHDVVGCDDNAYEWETAKYAGLSVKEAIDNADSFAHFAWDASKP
jgi:hypothetical protein